LVVSARRSRALVGQHERIAAPVEDQARPGRNYRRRHRMMRALVLAVILLLSAQAQALEIGARIPIKKGETFVVRNDLGIRNFHNHFPYGSVCKMDWHHPMWLVVNVIAAERVLLTIEVYYAMPMINYNCPDGTQTSLPLAEVQQRYDDYVRATDDKFIGSLR
jgi:hypothetical protein